MESVLEEKERDEKIILTRIKNSVELDFRMKNRKAWKLYLRLFEALLFEFKITHEIFLLSLNLSLTFLNFKSDKWYIS